MQECIEVLLELGDFGPLGPLFELAVVSRGQYLIVSEEDIDLLGVLDPHDLVREQDVVLFHMLRLRLRFGLGLGFGLRFRLRFGFGFVPLFIGSPLLTLLKGVMNRVFIPCVGISGFGNWRLGGFVLGFRLAFRH